eukprot:Rmarinus@m.19371
MGDVKLPPITQNGQPHAPAAAEPHPPSPPDAPSSTLLPNIREKIVRRRSSRKVDSGKLTAALAGSPEAPVDASERKSTSMLDQLGKLDEMDKELLLKKKDDLLQWYEASHMTDADRKIVRNEIFGDNDLACDWGKECRELVSVKMQQSRLEAHRDLANLQSIIEQEEERKRSRFIQVDAIAGVFNPVERRHLRRKYLESLLKTERGLLPSADQSRKALGRKLFSMTRNRSIEVHKEFALGASLVTRFGTMLSSATKRLVAKQTDTLYAKLESVAAGGTLRTKRTDATSRLHRKITLNPLDLTEGLELSGDDMKMSVYLRTMDDDSSAHEEDEASSNEDPSDVIGGGGGMGDAGMNDSENGGSDGEHGGSRNEETRERAPKWGRCNGTEGPWMVQRAEATSLLKKIETSLQWLRKREEAQPSINTTGAVRTLARIIDLAHPPSALHAALLTYPDRILELVFTRLEGLDYRIDQDDFSDAYTSELDAESKAMQEYQARKMATSTEFDPEAAHAAAQAAVQTAKADLETRFGKLRTGETTKASLLSDETLRVQQTHSSPGEEPPPSPGGRSKRLQLPFPHRTVNVVEDLLTQVYKRTDHECRFLYEVHPTCASEFVVGWTADIMHRSPFPGADDVSFGFRSDGTAWFNNVGVFYSEPFQLAKCVGVLTDLNTGTITLFVDGNSLGCGFGLDATHFDEKTRSVQASIIRRRHLIPSFALNYDVAPFVLDLLEQLEEDPKSMDPIMRLRVGAVEKTLEEARPMASLRVNFGGYGFAYPVPDVSPCDAYFEVRRRATEERSHAMNQEDRSMILREEKAEKRDSSTLEKQYLRFQHAITAPQPESYSSFPSTSTLRERAARTIQRAIRRFLTALYNELRGRSNLRPDLGGLALKRYAATMIQSRVRGRRTRKLLRTLEERYPKKPFFVLQDSALHIQSWYRMWQAKRLALRLRNRKTKEKVLNRGAALAIQRVWRGLTYRRRKRIAVVQETAAVEVQRFARGFLSRLYLRKWLGKKRTQWLLDVGKRFLKIRREVYAAITIQRHVRGMLVREDMRRKRAAYVKAVTLLQARWRGNHVRENLDIVTDNYRAIVLKDILRRQYARIAKRQKRLRELEKYVELGIVAPSASLAPVTRL